LPALGALGALGVLGVLGALVVLVAVAGLAGCANDPTPGTRQTEPTAAGSPATRATTATTARPSAATPTTRTPLVLAVHPTRPPMNLTVNTALAVIAGRVTNWTTLGSGRGPVRLAAGPQVTNAPVAARRESDRAALAAVERDRGAIAVVPATAVGPSVRTMAVAGHHPLREPAHYPIMIAGPPPGPVVTAAAVGDLMLGRRVGRAMAAAGDFSAVLRPTALRLADADLTVGNLENTLSRAGAPRQGYDSFGADPRAVRGLRLAGFDVLSLANNHVGDYGPQALVETVRLLRDAGLAAIGAGANLAEARRGAVVERAGVRFGFLAFNAIGETPTAGRRRPGAVSLRMQPRTGPLAAADLAAMLADIRTLRKRADVIVVYPHWGQQYTGEAVPDQRRVGRALVDVGADLVIGSHPHWVQGAEIYRGRLIAYSLGNFVFDMDFSRPTTEGVVLELVFWGARVKVAEFVPVRIGRDFAPRFLSRPAGQPILDRIWRASGPPFSAGSEARGP
jgi:poly-gamma-glutamate synthesis protein (capsule biosynthesis protein)